MYTEASKLNLIELLLKEKNERILKSVENLLVKPENNPSNNFKNFTNTLSPEELKTFEKNIDEGCESINESDWK